ncbi:MAG: hypothetical protein A2Y33_06175 [Spirochaetes bacterium GWF1_51_8]|nr:MAG: hypothetical protein A2Y33_06175 [Spirochaetes bacterium GWF1_51_8]
MIICPKCDAENPKGQKFCSECKAYLGQTPFGTVLLAWAMILGAYTYLVSTLVLFFSLIIEPFGLELALKLAGSIYAVLAGGYLLKLKGWAWVLSLTGFVGLAGFGGFNTVVYIINDFQTEWVEMVPSFTYLAIGIFCMIVLSVNSAYYFMDPNKPEKKKAVRAAG